MERTAIDLESVANVFKLLGDKTRLTMAKILDEDECCVCEFVEIFQMSQPAISQHLRKLRDAGVVKEERRGQWIYYSLNQASNLYPFVKQILQTLPDQGDKLRVLDKSGARITCC
ncbi:metalloregulator ArsR/SmtB family transcription factor [Salinibacillus aidingensis]